MVRVRTSTPHATARSTHRRGVRRAAQDASQVAQAEAGVRAEAGDPARLVLPLDDHDAAPPAARQRRAGGGEAGRAGPDDEGVDRRAPFGSRADDRGRQAGRDGGAAEEALTPPVGRPRATAYTPEVHRRDRGAERIAHFALGDPFAEAHDVAVGRIALDQAGVLEGPGPPFAQLGQAGNDRFLLRLGQREPGVTHLRNDVLGDGERRGQAGRPDAPDAGVALTLVHEIW